MIRPLSWLFVPAISEKLITKGIESDADAVIFDLEDAVAKERKADARAMLIHALQQQSPRQLFIRINDLETEYWQDDLRAVEELVSYSLMVPKVTSAIDIQKIEALTSRCNEIVPIIESAEGMWNVMEIAKASPTIRQLAFGAEDYCLDLSIQKTEDGSSLLHARSQVVLASRAAGLESPIDSVYTDFKDSDGFGKESMYHKALGFRGKLLIHPNQIEHLHSVYSVTSEEYTTAKAIKEAFEDAQQQGVASIQVNGKMVDYPVYNQAMKMIEQYETKKAKRL